MEVESTKLAPPKGSQWAHIWEMCQVEINRTFPFSPGMIREEGYVSLQILVYSETVITSISRQYQNTAGCIGCSISTTGSQASIVTLSIENIGLAQHNVTLV